ncbi:hypothetical protein KAH43_03285 [Candidatus Bipolaricaulota bacterium]|nr:hypothetical protein [Candidatus Bipolaricaulota bacterium]
MMRNRLSKLLSPFLLALAYPVLLKLLPSTRTVRVLWMAAIMSIVGQVGIDISRQITYRQAIGLLVVGESALVGCFLAGWISFQDARLEYLFGDIALFMVLLGLPLLVFGIKLNEKRTKGQNNE